MIIKVVSGYESEYKGKEVDSAVDRAQRAAELDGDNTFTGSNTFQGPVLLGLEATVETPDLDDDSKLVANTTFIKHQGYLKEITAEMIAEALGYTPESTANLTTSITAESTDAQYPSAKAVYNLTEEVTSIVADNTSAIAANTSAIETNSSLIATNTSNIASNTSAIETNSSLIATNTSNIASNTSAIETNASLIASNTSAIESNTSAIASNTSAIAVNTTNIATNTSNIVSNTSAIEANSSLIATNTSAIADINTLIPATATAENQLADKNFVNSSIATSTAIFIGTFNSVAELEAYTGQVDDNDYAFVVSTDTAGNTLYSRYKYSENQWLFEYTLNNSSFTSVQWAAINSGITDIAVTQIATNTSNITSNTSAIQANTSAIASNTSAIEINSSLIASNTSSIASNTSAIATNTSNIASNSSAIAVNTSAIADLGTSKQDVIDDLETIRAGATAGATALQPNDDITQLNNNAGYISGITASMITDALTYTPYDGTSNPEGFITNSAIADMQTVSNLVTSISSASTDTTYPSAKLLYDQLLLKQDKSSAVTRTVTTTATGSTVQPIYVDSDGVVNACTYELNKSVPSDAVFTDTKNTAGATNSNVKLYVVGAPSQTDNPQTFSRDTVYIDTDGVLHAVTPTVTASSTEVATTEWVTGKGYITGITSTDVTNALGFTPYDSTNPNGFITGISSSDVTNALGFTPYSSSNPSGYISGINSTMVTNALGYTPYDSSNPSGYISSASMSALTDTTISNVANGQGLIYNSSSGKWENANIVTSVAWGGITGTITDQTDLKNALDAKTLVTFRRWT